MPFSSSIIAKKNHKTEYYHNYYCYIIMANVTIRSSAKLFCWGLIPLYADDTQLYFSVKPSDVNNLTFAECSVKVVYFGL